MYMTVYAFTAGPKGDPVPKMIYGVPIAIFSIDKGVKKFVRLVEEEQSKGRKKQTAMEKKMFTGMFEKLSMDED